MALLKAGDAVLREAALVSLAYLGEERRRRAA
jgi:hypothetical protein